MKADLVVRNARVVQHDGEFHGGLAVKDGVIVAVGSDSALPEGTREIDAKDKVLMPGVIDPHCHLGVKYPYAEDMRTGHASLWGGEGAYIQSRDQVLEQLRAFFQAARAA